jgi:alkylation response protein AidB-like acyl-CoA dehydrogenase
MTRQDAAVVPSAAGGDGASPPGNEFTEQDKRVIARAARLAGEVLAPAAAAVDASGEIPRSHLAALAEAGLFGLRTPASAGGTPCSARAQRTCTELLAAADGSTYFVWLQHQLPLLLLKATANDELRDRLLPEAASGRVILGQALSHLSNPGQRSVAAERAAGGWRFSGTVRWYTGWGLNHLMAVGGIAPGGRAVIGFTDPAQASASEPLATVAMRAAQTVTLELRDVLVADEQVAWNASVPRWLDVVAARVDVPPGIVGLALATVRRLTEIAGARGDGSLASLAAAFTAALARDRDRAYELADEGADEAAGERMALKAGLALLAVEATTALVVAEGGSSMLSGSQAQRWAREALFYLVHAQTAAVRDAQARQLLSAVAPCAR